MNGNTMELIAQRTSVRSYAGTPLDDGMKQELIERISACPPNPFVGAVRLSLAAGNGADGQKLGTYGMISRARDFLIGVGDGSPTDKEALGYALEWAVLQATDLGLGTCWISGTFDRSQFVTAANLTGGERVLAVSPVGLAAARPTLRSRLVHLTGAGRKDWTALFFDGDPATPLTPEAAGNWRDVLEAVRLAPSAANGQPWRVIRREGQFDFYRRETAAVDGRLDLGIAICHFELVAQEQGLPGHWLAEAPTHTPDGLRYVLSWVQA